MALRNGSVYQRQPSRRRLLVADTRNPTWIGTYTPVGVLSGTPWPNARRGPNVIGLELRRER
jgi:hypothetical protein